MKALVGYTGFVGSNLYECGQFEQAYNSKNIQKAYGSCPDLLVYAGLRAEKYLANSNPHKDMEQIEAAMENILKIKPKRLVLISTIDVFKDPRGVNENTLVDTENLHAYGLNRYRLECRVRENYPDALIVRLPALFGKNIKKNFIYDYMKFIPAMLKEDKFIQLQEQKAELNDYYVPQENGFYRCRKLTKEERTWLKQLFREVGFSALHFTDSRSRYQFYPLDRLWADIQTALEQNILLWHPATEPISAAELYQELSGDIFENHLPGTPADYNYRTIHDKAFGGKNGYLCGKEEVIRKIKEFTKTYAEG